MEEGEDDGVRIACAVGEDFDTVVEFGFGDVR